LTAEKKDSLLQYAIEDDRTFSSLISKFWAIGYATRESKMSGDEGENKIEK